MGCRKKPWRARLLNFFKLPSWWACTTPKFTKKTTNNLGFELVGVHDSQDATEWRILCKRAQQRLRQGDYDFSIGALVCLDIAIERQA